MPRFEAMTFPLNTVYCASKSYVLHFSEGIAEDLAGTGVSVTALCSGTTATDLITKVGMEKTNLFIGSKMRLEVVARKAVGAMLKGKRVIVPGMRNKCLVASVRLIPRGVTTCVGKIVMKENPSMLERTFRFVCSLG